MLPPLPSGSLEEITTPASDRYVSSKKAADKSSKEPADNYPVFPNLSKGRNDKKRKNNGIKSSFLTIFRN
jgi:hypothetical protein